MKRRVWFERRFDLGLPPEALPDIVERLRGTPLRLRERTEGLEREALTASTAGWSIQEHAGHLLDLEPLWTGRLHELRTGAQTLRAADLENRRTHEAGHNAADLEHLLDDFAAVRARWVADVEALSEADIARTALHPRLQQPMSAVDLCFFVAEHDDHHLASITALLP
jgi:uncharacterized damage-inducible protein DinB